MIVRLASAIVVLAVCATSADAQILFGTREDIHPIQDVALQGPEGALLFLGYKTSTSYFLGGLTMSNDGYVLGLRTDHGRFLDMPQGKDLKAFQAKGLLPDPLPPYSIGLFEYVRGYSLWLVLAAIIAAGAFFFLMRRRARPAGY